MFEECESVKAIHLAALAIVIVRAFTKNKDDNGTERRRERERERSCCPLHDYSCGNRINKEIRGKRRRKTILTSIKMPYMLAMEQRHTAGPRDLNNVMNMWIMVVNVTLLSCHFFPSFFLPFALLFDSDSLFFCI